MARTSHKIAATFAMSLTTAMVLVACSATPAVKVTTAPPTGTVKGVVTVTDDGNITGSSQGTMPCELMSSSGYSDFKTGAEIDAVDASGKVLAFGYLEPGSAPSPDDLFKSCAFPYSIEGVLRGEKVYGLQFGRRGIVHYKASTMFGGHADLNIGG
ncbi:hypothetical protein [Amnibacterium kyonggiense]|uniref:Lipoprotein n=1 Tax=Amnibacterium kyonggiense TaxID=595671 RepID=A0A4R7FTR5_9MICO|nr:hypothetical protein [Amnibacterium kyonggiense]TDS81119.1 hypothetical protein CLV52_1695 [Amnibacterium kyonggiense]